MTKAPPKPKPPSTADDEEQSRRFIDMAREVEADESGGMFEKVLDNTRLPGNAHSEKHDASTPPKQR